MPCYPFRSEDGSVFGWICGPGDYQHLVRAYCPWCCFREDKRSRTVQAIRLVHSGYCGHDYICGRCGYAGNIEDETLKRPSESDREENIKFVRDMKRSGIRVGPFPLPPDLEGP